MNLHQQQSELRRLTNNLEKLNLSNDEIDSLFVSWRFEAIRSQKPMHEFLVSKVNEKIEELCQGK